MSVTLERKFTHEPAAAACYDAVVVGAGPYGLSTAAHLLERGLRVAVFGKTLELWRTRMPEGMLLRSHWWATNLSDPRKRYSFGRFLSQSIYKKGHPLPIDAFIDYALWFQTHAVPNVDETYVSSIERHGDHFLLTLDDGRRIESADIVMATGLCYYAHCPGQFDHLPPGLVSHSCEDNDLNRFTGTEVIVIGGGQSAIEYAALLSEVGATVHVVSRRPLSWLARDTADERSIFERILAPNTGLSPGWKNWILVRVPDVFYGFPQERKDRHNGYYRAEAAEWLWDRVVGKVTLHEGQTVVTAEPAEGKVDITISDGKKVRADHIILATGYRVDVSKLTMIHPSLLDEIRTDRARPLLSRSFESSVPGLYFVGLTSVHAFGPPYRFVVGCTATAYRVASSIAGKKAGRRLASIIAAHI